MSGLMPVDAIESYRAFAVDGDTLVAPVADVEWEPGINTSQCRRCPDAPRRACSCGFYSFRTQAIALDEWEGAMSRGRALSGRPVGGITLGRGELEVVLAMVKNAGVIWRGSRGYRSQHAQVSAVLTAHPDQFEAVLERYGVIPVVPGLDGDGGRCSGIVRGFANGDPGIAIVSVLGLGPREGTGEYHISAEDPAYTEVALAGEGAPVEITFEHRAGRRWIKRIRVGSHPV